MNHPFLLAQSAEATAQPVWQLQYDWSWPPWATVLFVAAVVLLITFYYTRESSPAGPLYRGILCVLRLTTIALVLVMLSELMLTSSQRGLPRLHVIIDTSASMNLPASLPDGQDASRLEAARQLLLSDRPHLLDNWLKNYELQVLAAADGSRVLPGTDAESLARAINEINAEGPEANRSRLGDALHGVVAAEGEVPAAAIVLLTDGRNSAGRSLDEVRNVARHRGVPLYVVGLGSTEAPADLALVGLVADEVALAGDLVAMEVSVASRGLAGETATVRVKDTQTGETVYEEKVPLAEEGMQPVQLLVRPKEPGQITYRLEVTGPEEEQDTDNNHLDHTIDVRDEKLRVLLAAGYPNYEFRYLESLLARDSTFELTTFLQEADVEHPSQDAAAVAQLPLKEEQIEEFDVVVLIDLDPRLAPPRWWQNVQNLVVRRGGGLVLVAGPRHFPAQYTSVSEVVDLSPIVPATVRTPTGVVDSGFAIELTPLGKQRPSMQLGTSQSESAAIWDSLPDQYWYADAEQVKPAAQVLAVHPRARTSEGRPLPLICLQYVGSGRVLYHGIDSTWRWRYRVGDAWFARYWGQSLRHLARSKTAAGDDGAEIFLERQQFELGEAVRIQVRLNDPGQSQSGAPPQVSIEAEGLPARRVPLTANPLVPNILQGTASQLPPGHYRIRLLEPSLPQPPDAVPFSVQAPPGELAISTMNEEGLRALAKETYGKFYTLENVAELADDLPRGSRTIQHVLPPVELWNRWWMLAAITGCLTLEWILRKRRALL